MDLYISFILQLMALPQTHNYQLHLAPSFVVPTSITAASSFATAAVASSFVAHAADLAFAFTVIRPYLKKIAFFNFVNFFNLLYSLKF